MVLVEPVRERRSHIFARDADDHYVEPEDCSEAIFAAETFIGKIHDPCCGWGRIPEAARRVGLKATAADIVDRGYPACVIEDFLKSDLQRDNIVCNPPFKDKNIKRFMLHALDVTKRKVAMIFPVARMNAAGWMQETPLRTMWLLTPRPSIPPGSYIAAGNNPGGGRPDFCWLVWEHGHQGPPGLRWLNRRRSRSGCRAIV